jgi:hypothetical protein
MVRLEGDTADESYAVSAFVGDVYRTSNPKLHSRLEIVVVNVVEGLANGKSSEIGLEGRSTSRLGFEPNLLISISQRLT